MVGTLLSERAADWRAEAVEKMAFDAMKHELEKSEAERWDSLRQLSQELSGLVARLASAEARASPWSKINDAKAQVEAVKSRVGEQINDAKQKQERIESQPQSTSRKFRAMRDGVVKSQLERRASLSDVQDELTSISAKLHTAQASWTPWSKVSDAKLQVMNVQDIVHEIGEQANVASQRAASTSRRMMVVGSSWRLFMGARRLKPSEMPWHWTFEERLFWLIGGRVHGHRMPVKLQRTARIS